MLLYGDRWCAYFRSTALYEGVVQLSGVFEADWAGVVPVEAQVAGTVAGRQLITRTSSPGIDGRHRTGVDVLGPVREGRALWCGVWCCFGRDIAYPAASIFQWRCTSVSSLGSGSRRDIGTGVIPTGTGRSSPVLSVPLGNIAIHDNIVQPASPNPSPLPSSR